MFLLDFPYVSDFLKRTLVETQIPVIATDAARRLGLPPGVRMRDEATACRCAARPDAPPIYLNSENAIGWLARHEAFAGLSADIDRFKDKLKFREMIAPMDPEFYFRGVALSALRSLPLDDVPLPAIIKPSVGFFSMGVHRIERRNQWAAAFDAIEAEIDRAAGLYPEAVLNLDTFIVEACIEGEEFAVDAYFDAEGTPVILGIFAHAFASKDDVGDRVYTTSQAIVADNLAPFTAFLADVGRRAGVRRFPVHVELRRDAAGTIRPIEVNPMRFGGWCTTADLTFHAFGVNPYVLYAEQRKPDWAAIFAGADDSLYSIVVLDNSTGIPARDIAAFDYDALLAGFETPLELRKIDYAQYPVFGFLFTKTRADNFAELQAILESDLRAFVVREPVPTP